MQQRNICDIGERESVANNVLTITQRLFENAKVSLDLCLGDLHSTVVPGFRWPKSLGEQDRGGMDGKLRITKTQM